MSQHAATALPIPQMPRRLKYQILHAIQLVLPSAPDKPLFSPIYKFLPGLRYTLHAAHAVYFHLSLTSTTFCFNVTMAEEFIKVNNKYAAYNTLFTATSNNTTGALDNSANILVLKDRSLFVSEIMPCSIRVNVGIFVGSTPPQGIGTARID